MSVDDLGKFNILMDLEPSDSKTNFQSLILINQITVRTKSDTHACHITGCAFISPSRLLLAEYDNKKLKILEINQESVVEEMSLKTSPFDIAILPQNQVAVSLPAKQEILILSTTSQLTTLRSIPVNRICWGLVYHQDLL